MPPKANVIIFEDNRDTANTYITELEGSGHRVMGTAGNIEALENLLPRLQHQLLIEASRGQVVALVDNNAPWREGQEPDPKGVGRYATRRLREVLGGGVITVASTMTKNPSYGDHHFDPREEGLGRFVTSLRSKEF